MASWSANQPEILSAFVAVDNNVRKSVTLGTYCHCAEKFTFLRARRSFTLRQQDYALLMGTVALFVLLGIVMYVTRKVDWYARDLG